MRVSPRDLKAVQVNGFLTRYALLGAAVFVIVELPPGTVATTLEEQCRLEHWGLVVRGSLAVVGAAQRRTLGPGTAFYVAPGETHRLEAEPRTVIAGLSPVVEPVDDSPAALETRGILPLWGIGTPALPPKTVQVDGLQTHRAIAGQIEMEAAVMGDWLFTRSSFGPLSGHVVDWCDLPHWGLVLDGDLVMRWDDGTLELLGPGDAFHAPPGPPGHRFEVADSATIVDYTPIGAFRDSGRRQARRAMAAIRAETDSDDVPA